MNKLFIFAYFLLCAVMPIKAHAEDGPNMRLFQPAVRLISCVEMISEREISRLDKKLKSDPSSAEIKVFNVVVDLCAGVLRNYENESLVYSNYKGNEASIKAYRDGLWWSARSYVFLRVDDWSKN